MSPSEHPAYVMKPAFPQAYYGDLARIHSRQHQYDRELQMLRLQMGLVYIQEGLTERAIPEFRAALRGLPGRAEAYY